MISDIKLVFMGTPEFSAIILERLINSEYRPVLVITEPDKPVGRKQIITPSPAKIIAQKYNISLAQPEKILNLKSEILNLNPDLGIVAAYGKILPEDILNIPKYGFINVHPSLLPKHRGASPIQCSILNGDKKTGVTIILMDSKIDHGPVLAQKQTVVGPNETGELLSDRLAYLGADLLIKTIPRWIEGKIKLQNQNEKEATYAKILTREDGKIDWGKPAKEIERQIRAFDSWPGSFTFWQLLKNKLIRVKITKARVYKSPIRIPKRYPLGKVLIIPPNEIGIQCKKDFLAVKKVQIEGKKEMASENFLRGHPDFIGTILR